MFKMGSIENELIQTMEEKLVTNSLEKGNKFTKIAKVLDYLNAAADIFDKTGFNSESEELTNILNTIYNSINKKG